jgi:TPR repeat protein
MSKCRNCQIDLISYGKCSVCYYCGELHCFSCLIKRKNECSCCKKTISNSKKRSLDFETKKLEKVLEKNPKHKNKAIISSTLGRYYLSKKDIIKAYRYSLAAANYGIPCDQYYIGCINYYKDYANYQEAHKWFMLAAESKCSEALVMLEHMYNCGIGVKQDKERAKVFGILSKIY